MYKYVYDTTRFVMVTRTVVFSHVAVMLMIGQRLTAGRGPRPAHPSPKFENPIRIMPASTPCLTELPIEILEQIFLHLPAQDIIKMDVVRRLAINSARSSVDSSIA